MAPAFSVLVPTFGRPAFLAEALASVVGQTFTDFECVVVDDATPDTEPPVLPDERFRLIRRPTNGGPAAARNTGITATAGDHVAFLDDDDVWTPDRLALAVAGHEQAPVAVCSQSTVGATEQVHGRMLSGDVSDSILDGITPHLGATSVRRDAIVAFDERFRGSEDVEWWLRLAQGRPVTTSAQVGLLYRRHGESRPEATGGERLHGAQLLLTEHAQWFADHPRAQAFRLKRMGLMALQSNDRALARRCFARSLRLRPEPRTAWHFSRSLAPARAGSR